MGHAMKLHVKSATGGRGLIAMCEKRRHGLPLWRVWRRSRQALLIASILLASRGFAQGPPGGAAQPPRAPKAAAPIDLTGYWVSIVTEDWRYRMLTPAKGDYASVPMTADARKVADAWDPAKDVASGNACKAYGAPGLTRQPGRLHITWDNDNMLKVEFDAGTQTRMLNF